MASRVQHHPEGALRAAHSGQTLVQALSFRVTRVSAPTREKTMNIKESAFLMTAIASLVAALAQVIGAIRCGP